MKTLPPRRLNLIVGKFAPLHRGHQLLIETALRDTTDPDFLVILVYSNPDFPEMPSSLRADWVRQLYPKARVYVPENPPPNEADDFTQREFVKRWLEANYSGYLEHLYVYTSEDYGEGFARHLGARHVQVDRQRKRFPISGTRLRGWLEELRRKSSYWPVGVGGLRYEDADELLQKIAGQVCEPVLCSLQFRYEPVRKVVFLGAESTGKSTLTERMARAFRTRFVAEYGREHYERKGGRLELKDYLEIAHKHRELEEAALREAQDFLFVDTNALTTLFFSYYYNGGGLPELHQLANECKTRYHHVFVCADDIPFEQDGWRDNSLWRARMQGLVMHDLDVRGIPYLVVRGGLEERVEQVKAVLEGRPLNIPEAPIRHLGPRPLR